MPPSSKIVPSPTSTLPPGQAQLRVLRQFRIIFNAVKTHFRQVERVAGIGGAQLWALSVIQQQPAIGIKELARALDIQQSTASNLVRNLLERELVDATREGPDRRTVALRLRDSGAAILARAPAPFAGVLPDALAELDTPTLLRMEADLAALIVLVEGDQAAAAVPLAEL